MNDINGLETIEADLLFFPLTVHQLKPIATIEPHPSEVFVRRDQNFKIKLEMKGKVSDPRDLDIDRNIRPGTVTEAESTEGKSCHGQFIVKFKGIACGSWSHDCIGEFNLIGSAARVTEEYRPAVEIGSTIVHLLGFPSVLASRVSQRELSGDIQLHRPDIPEMGAAQTIKKPAAGNIYQSGRDCMLMSSKYGTCLFSKGASSEISRQFSPSYLHFVSGEALTSEERRSAYLEAVSFVFGKRFIDVGYTDLDNNNDLIRRSARTPYTSNIHAEVANADLPPAPVVEMYGYVNESVVSKILNLYLDARDKYKLSDVMWYIWTARMMPMGLELVAYGSALEGLINAWFADSERHDRSYYVPKDEFEALTDSHVKELREVAPKTSSWEKVITLISKANQLSITDKYKRFFEELGLKTGKVEDEVIRSRHKFAHGRSFEDVEVKRLIVIARAYEALLNRCILKVIGYQGDYLDYSTLDFPERPLDEQLGGPNNDRMI